nr:GNAT family N-acetyltransferase [Oceanipulchritudo coccoides]
MNSDLILEPVDRENWIECAELEVEPDQAGHLASNLKTIAESAFEPHYQLRAIKAENKIVGMLAYCPEVDEPIQGLYWLFRIMIDKAYQSRGYGKRAIKLAVEEMWKKGAIQIRTMCRPDNQIAQACYSSLGFSKAGTLDDGDMVFELAKPIIQTSP